MKADIGKWVLDQCRETPERVALKTAHEELTYARLAQLVERVAGLMTESGISCGDCVAVDTARPHEAIVGFLAALRCGAHYVPISPALPADRLALIVAQTGCKAVVQSSKIGDERIQGIHSVVVDLTCNAAALSPSSCDPRPSDLAYVIYTSGSTGTPKGVAVTRENLRFSTWARHEYYQAPVETFLLVSPLTFDSSVAGIYWTLTCGGTLCLADAQARQDIHALRRMIRDEKVSHLLCIPSLWNLLLDDDHASELESLKTVVVAGEACTSSLASKHHSLCPTTQLHNEYGPTEGSVWCTVHRVLAQDKHASVPIGKAIPGATIHVLQEDGSPVHNGDEGEIYVSGPGVAAGYIAAPQLTAERFVDDPFSEGPSRMYRTGDYARRLPDGSLIFLGRRDGQVKIRGHRIEVEEVENVIGGHPLVKEAVVVVRDDTSTKRSLVGFVVPANGKVPAQDELRAFAAESLPPYMVPHTIVARESIPRTLNGKIDRKLLSAERITEPATKRFDAAPATFNQVYQTETQSQVAALFRQLLDQPRVGLDETFFSLGGDSLQAMELTTGVKKRFGVEIEVSQLLAASTVRLLSKLVDSGAAEQTSCLVPIQPNGSRTPLFCIHPGGGNVVCYLPLADELGSDQPIFGIRAPGVEPNETPLDSVVEMASEYIRLMKTVQPQGPYQVAGWSFGAIVSYEIASQLERSGDEVALLAVIDGSPIYSIAVLREVFPNSNLALTRINESHADQYYEEFRKGATDAMLITKGASREHTERVLGLFASTMRAAVDYRPKPIQTQMNLLVAEQKIGKTKYSPFQDWKRSCETIELHEVPGGHLNMMQQPHVSTLAAKLKALMDTSAVSQRNGNARAPLAS